MDKTKQWSMVILSLATIYAGLIMIGNYFSMDFLEWAGSQQGVAQALLGVLVLGYGLIGLRWYWGQQKK